MAAALEFLQNQHLSAEDTSAVRDIFERCRVELPLCVQLRDKLPGPLNTVKAQVYAPVSDDGWAWTPKSQRRIFQFQFPGVDYEDVMRLIPQGVVHVGAVHVPMRIESIDVARCTVSLSPAISEQQQQQQQQHEQPPPSPIAGSPRHADGTPIELASLVTSPRELLALQSPPFPSLPAPPSLIVTLELEDYLVRMCRQGMVIDGEFHQLSDGKWFLVTQPDSLVWPSPCVKPVTPKARIESQYDDGDDDDYDACDLDDDYD